MSALQPSGEGSACKNREKDSPRMTSSTSWCCSRTCCPWYCRTCHEYCDQQPLDMDLRAQPRRTQVLDRFIVPSHWSTDRNASSIDVRASTMRTLGCARRVLKFQRTHRHRRPRGQIRYYNLLSARPRIQDFLLKRETDNEGQRLRSLLANYFTMAFTSLILAFYWGPLLTLAILSALPILIIVQGFSQALAGSRFAHERNRSSCACSISCITCSH